jgi:glucan 1,3-beta-glucosidase
VRSYLEAHNMIRSITGIGKGPYISIHDGFQGTAPWVNFLRGSDRIAMDQHPYFAFGGPMVDPFINGTGSGAGGVWPSKACNAWASGIVQSQETFGITVAGEFSGGWNDCGTFLHGVGQTGTTFTGNCTQWTDWVNYSQEQKDGLNNFISASMDALQNWFFWTWKVRSHHRLC